MAAVAAAAAIADRKTRMPRGTGRAAIRFDEALLDVPRQLSRQMRGSHRQRQHHHRVKEAERNQPAERRNQASAERRLETGWNHRGELTEEPFALEVRANRDEHHLESGEHRRHAGQQSLVPTGRPADEPREHHASSE